MTESKNLRNDELLTMMEEMQDEIESLSAENSKLRKTIEDQNSKSFEAQQTISDLSSQISELMNEVRSQKRQIVDLSEKNARLNNSDLELQEAEKLMEKANSDMYKASILASDTKREKEKMSKEFSARERAVSQKENHISKIANNLEHEIKKHVDRIVYEEKEKLEAQYQNTERTLRKRVRAILDKHEFGYYTSVTYAIITTIAAAILLEPYRNEFADFWIKFAKNLGIVFSTIAGAIDQVASVVQADTGSYATYIIVTVFLSLLIKVPTILLLIQSVKFLYKNIKEDVWDEVSGVIVIVIIGVSIYFSPLLIKLPINVITLGVLSLTAYVTGRFFYEWSWEDLKKKILFWAIYLPVGIFIIKKLMKWGIK